MQIIDITDSPQALQTSSKETIDVGHQNNIVNSIAKSTEIVDICASSDNVNMRQILFLLVSKTSKKQKEKQKLMAK